MIEPTAENLAAFNGSFTVENSSADNLAKLIFKEQQNARVFFEVFAHLLPFLNTEYPQISDKVILLTQEQYFFYQRCIMAEKGKLTSAYLGDCFLKTLRTDEFDFSHAFILGIIPGENNTRRHQNLRPRNRQPVTITPEGKIAARLEKQPTYTTKEKEGFSQNQSCTHIDEETLSNAFGFGKDRHSKLFGLMTHIDDILISRLLLSDSGTVTRIFDFSCTETAKSSSSYKNYSNGFIFPPTQFNSFKNKNLGIRQNKGGTNEVLARLRFNPYRSVVTICTDTLEARLLAQDFAQELLHHFVVYAKSHGMILNPRFKLPIIFYVPKKSHETRGYREPHGHALKFYTPAMLQEDRAEAARIYNNENRRIECYRNYDYEFLLGLEVITPEILLERIDNAPLALAMMRSGKVRMLMRVMRTSTQANLRDRVFDSLLAEGMIAQNDPIIAKLIMAESFDIADKIINATNSLKTELKFDGKLLIDHLVSNGNPRHLQYMNLNQMLVHAAKNRSWISIALCIKEFGHLKETSESLDTYGNGYLLFKALEDQQLKLATFFLQAGAKSTWRNQQTDINHQLLSTLYYAVNFDLNELLPDLIEHEKECQNEFYQARLWLALDLAYCRKNNTAIALLEKICSPVSLDPKNIEVSICKLINEALIVGNREIAEFRLIRYCHQYNLLPENNTNILDGLEILQAHLSAIVVTEVAVILTEIIMQPKPRKSCDHDDEFEGFLFLPTENTSFRHAVIEKRYREANLLFKLTMTAEDVRRELHKQVKSEKWSIVEFFTRYPTDTEDTLGYGYALLKALEHQLPKLAKLLLQAGAKATWGNWKTDDDHPLVSPLLHAVNYNYHELLPQLIELEKSNPDDRTQTRLRLALDLAYVRSNRKTINLLEQNNVQAALIDTSNIIKSICAHVLEAFSVGNKQVGELRLLRYCHAYNLMSKENRRVVDGLDIIKNHILDSLKSLSLKEILKTLTLLFEIIMSDLKSELLTSSLNLLDCDYSDDSQQQVRITIYSTIVKYLTSDNVNTVDSIIRRHESTKGFHSCKWRSVTEDEFSKRISPKSQSHTPDPVVKSLYKLGIALSSHAYFQAFEYAVATRDEELSIMLLNGPLVGVAVKERSLITAIEKSNTPYILFLIKNINFTVTIELLLTAVKRDLFLVLLSLLKKNSDTIKVSKNVHNWACYSKWSYTFPQDHLWTLYSIWAYTSLTDDRRRASCNSLARLLGPSMVMHFTLINVLVVLSSKYIEANSRSSWFNLDQVLDKVKSAILNFSSFAKKHNLKYNPKDSNTHKEILALLNDYFARIGTLPEDAIIISAFKKMQETFNTLYNSSFSGSFFKIRPLNQRDYNTEIYNALRDVAQALKNSDTPDEPPFEYNVNDEMLSIVHNKT
ncbi:MAG: hypothetical protein K2X50_07130 [Gammaproteobacteria bacterium]|nr:hypothetical protein [Gammaproteobacteria bacterium]